MRINLTKQEIVNSIFMQIGYSKKVAETLLEDFFDIILQSLKKSKKVKIAKFGTFEIREKKKELEEIQKPMKEKLYLKEKLYFSNPLKN